MSPEKSPPRLFGYYITWAQTEELPLDGFVGFPLIGSGEQSHTSRGFLASPASLAMLERLRGSPAVFRCLSENAYRVQIPDLEDKPQGRVKGFVIPGRTRAGARGRSLRPHIAYRQAMRVHSICIAYA